MDPKHCVCLFKIVGFEYVYLQVPDCILNPDLSKKKHKRHPIHRTLGGRSMAGFTQDTPKPKEVSCEVSNRVN